MNIFELLQELQSFITVDAETLRKAKAANITVMNNKAFNKIGIDWIGGKYDNDPEVLLQNLKALL